MAKSHNLDSASRPTNTPDFESGDVHFNLTQRKKCPPSSPHEYPRLRVGGFCSNTEGRNLPFLTAVGPAKPREERALKPSQPGVMGL